MVVWRGKNNEKQKNELVKLFYVRLPVRFIFHLVVLVRLAGGFNAFFRVCGIHHVWIVIMSIIIFIMIIIISISIIIIVLNHETVIIIIIIVVIIIHQVYFCMLCCDWFCWLVQGIINTTSQNMSIFTESIVFSYIFSWWSSQNPWAAFASHVMDHARSRESEKPLGVFSMVDFIAKLDSESVSPALPRNMALVNLRMPHLFGCWLGNMMKPCPWNNYIYVEWYESIYHTTASYFWVMLHIWNIYQHLPKNHPNVDKYSIHGASGMDLGLHHFPTHRYFEKWKISILWHSPVGQRKGRCMLGYHVPLPLPCMFIYIYIHIYVYIYIHICIHVYVCI